MSAPDDIDPPQSGSGLFKATTQPSLDEIRALAIRVLQGPASKTEQVLAAAFLDARRQTERLEAQTPEQVASSILHLHLCPGRLAQGSEARCHPDAEPGGWDLGLGMVGIEPNGQVFQSLAEAKAYALLVQRCIAAAIEKGRLGTAEPYDIAAITEADFAETAAEHRRRLAKERR